MNLNDLMKSYVSTNMIVLLAKSTDPSTWQKLHSLLPILHKQLSCQVCHKLLDQLNSYSGGYACTECLNNQITESTPSMIIQCYKNMCSYIHSSPLYKVMCTRVEDKRLVELITEVIGLSRSINGYSGMVNGAVNKQETKKDSEDNTVLISSSDNITLPTENQTSEDFTNLQIFDVQSQKHKIQNQSVFNNIPKKKKNERRWGCRCGNATTTPGKLRQTCFGQRCPCYTDHKPCDQCKCRGCRNPKQKRSNNDDNLEIDKIRRKPVTLELVSSLKPSSHNKSNSAFSSYTMHDNTLQISSHSQNVDQGGTEDKLGHVNSIFHSP